MPSFNEITGARISSGSHVKGTDKEKFNAGWDRIFSKDAVIGVTVLEHGTLMSSIPQHLLDTKAQPECENCCGSGWVETWGPEGEGAEDCGECAARNNCPHCDYGDFPCNLNCAGC